MRMIFAVVFAALLAPSAINAQNWGDLDALIRTTLTGGAQPESAQFMPDTGDPATATRALAVAYVHIPGSAGSVSIHSGFYQRTDAGWVLIRQIDGLFGLGPADPVFGPDWVELTTATLGPGDPRCCPSQRTRWRITTTTGAVQQLN